MATTMITLRIEDETLQQADRVITLAQKVAMVDLTSSKVLKTAMALGLQLMEAKYAKLAKV